MPCFQRVHRLRLSCRLAYRLITRRRVFFIFAYTAKNRRIPPPLSSKDMLGGNYLIAQQLPASSPFSQAITVYIMCQIYARAFLYFFKFFWHVNRVFSTCIWCSSMTRIHAFFFNELCDSHPWWAAVRFQSWRLVRLAVST